MQNQNTDPHMKKMYIHKIVNVLGSDGKLACCE